MPSGPGVTLEAPARKWLGRRIGAANRPVLRDCILLPTDFMCRIIFGSEIRPEPKMATYGDFWCKARIPHKLMIAQETAEHKGRACTRRWCYPLRTSGKRGIKERPRPKRPEAGDFAEAIIACLLRRRGPWGSSQMHISSSAETLPRKSVDDLGRLRSTGGWGPLNIPQCQQMA